MARYPNDQRNPQSAIPVYVVSAPTLMAGNDPTLMAGNNQRNPQAALPVYQTTAPSMLTVPTDGNTYGAINSTTREGEVTSEWVQVLSITGGALTGPLFLVADPAGDMPLAATTKHYVDNVDNMKVNKFGDTMTGPLTLAAAPAQPLDAATKAYVDEAIAALRAELLP